jgi:predicted CxxxxCH...CXXCH cytochrome family protein
VDADGKVKAILEDLHSKAWVTTVNFINPTPAPNGEAIYNAQCQGCHSINGYDASGSPDLAGIGNLIAAKFATSHNGNTLSGAEQTAVAGFLDQYTAPPTGDGCTNCHAQPPSAGAHLVHSNLPNVDTDCTVCHGGATHNGIVDQDIMDTYNSMNSTAVANANQTCSSVSCHGGQTTPNWMTGSLNVETDCRSCHTLGTSDFNSYNSGKHSRGVHVNRACTDCHNVTSLAPNHFSNLNTTNMEGPASATIGGGSTQVSSYNPSTGSCTASCHGSKNW